MMADPRFVLAVSLIITQAAQACIPIFTPPQEATTAAPTTAINPSGEIHCCNKTRGHQPVSLQSPILTPRVNYCSLLDPGKSDHAHGYQGMHGYWICTLTDFDNFQDL